MTLPSHMHAVIAAPDTPLTWAETDMPAIGPSDILIKTEAAGLNRADLIQRTGAYPPPPGASQIMGLEVAGTVAAVGASVTQWRVGDRVCALLAGGGYAEYAAVDEGSVLPAPQDMSWEEVCCFPEAVFTVWANVFDRVNLTAGEAFLCHGGTSGIGVMAIQMAKLMGAAPIFATAGSDEKCQMIRDLGAQTAINYKTADFAEIVKAAGGADVTLDMVGGDYIQRNISAAKMDGRIINIAYMNGFQADVNFAPVLMKRLTLAATTLRARPAPEKRRLRDAIAKQVWPSVMDKTLKPVIDSVFSFTDAENAQARMSAGGHSGKIILSRSA